MSSKEIHRSQAVHNQKLANTLVEEGIYIDWAITAAFYSAIHYFEHWCIENNETVSGRFESKHSQREALIRKKLGKKAFKCFQKMREASETARYLVSYKKSHISKLKQTAPEYFDTESAKKIVKQCLVDFIGELK